MGARASRWRRWVWAAAKVALLGAVAASAVYWFRFSPVPVEAHRVETGSVIAEVMGTGTLEPRVRASASPRITGRLSAVLADQGDRVKAGQLVATLDDSDLRQQVEVAKAELSLAKATVDRAAAGIVRAQANAVQARASYARFEQLARGSLASQEDLDKSTQQRAVAEADLSLAELAKVESERAAVKAAASLRYYEERLADTRIVAPFDGLVVLRGREPGDVVVPGGTILEVVSTDDLWVSAWIDETAMGRLAVGQAARVVFRSAPDAPLPGKVARLAPQTDPEAREFLVDVRVDTLPATWAVGQRAEVYIDTGRREGVLVLPQRLVSWHGDVPRVLIDDAGVARWTEVTLGLRGGEVVEVTDGLTAGQVVLGIPPGSEPPREGRAIRYELP
jgi:RND family efflux transporter MFP subunit